MGGGTEGVINGLTLEEVLFQTDPRKRVTRLGRVPGRLSHTSL